MSKSTIAIAEDGLPRTKSVFRQADAALASLVTLCLRTHLRVHLRTDGYAQPYRTLRYGCNSHSRVGRSWLRLAPMGELTRNSLWAGIRGCDVAPHGWRSATQVHAYELQLA